MSTITIRNDWENKPSLINPFDTCQGCGCEPEVMTYFIRKYPRTSNKELVPVRVGYHCTCGAVVVDGLYQGSSPRP